MAEPARSTPEGATLGDADDGIDEAGREAMERALAAHGEEIAAVVERTDEAEDLFATAILVAAAADDAEVEHLVDRLSNLVAAADGIATDDTAALAEQLGEDADDLGETLDTLLALQRQGALDDLVTVAAAFTGSLSPDQLDRLATAMEADGDAVVDLVERLLELGSAGDLEELLDLAETASALELDEDGVAALNDVLGAVGDARRDAEPVGLLGLLGVLRDGDARAGLGYLVELLRSLGRRVR